MSAVVTQGCEVTARGSVSLHGLVNVSARRDPFDHTDVKHFCVDPELRLSQIVERAYGDEAYLFREYGHIEIEGIPIPRTHWHLVRAKSSTLVTMYFVPGDSDSIKSSIGVVAAVALAIAATVVSAGALAPYLPASLSTAFAAGGIGSLVTAGALGIAGTLALSALAPPPLAPNISTANLSQQKQIAGINPNTVQPLAYLPAVLGTMRFSPPQLIFPYTTLEDGEIYAHVIVGLAGEYRIEQVMLDSILADNIDTVDYETRDGGAVDTSNFTLVAESVIPQAAGFLMTNFALSSSDSETINELANPESPTESYPKWHYFTTDGIPDEVRLRFLFPAGMAKTDTNTQAYVIMRVEIKRRGQGTWLKLPIIHFYDAGVGTQNLRQELRIKWRSGFAGGPRRNYLFTGGNGIKGVYFRTQDGDPLEYEANSYFAQSASNTDAIPDMTGGTTLGVTVTGTPAPSNPGWRACDDDTATSYNPGATAAILHIDFGAGNEKTARSYSIFTDNNNEPRDWTVEGSTDNVNWTVLDTRTDFFQNTWPRAVGGAALREIWFQIDTAVQASYRYYRLNITAANGNIELREFELSETNAQGTNVTAAIDFIDGAKNVDIHRDGVDVHLDTATWPVDDEYDIRVMRSCVVDTTTFNDQTYTYGTVQRANFFEESDVTAGEIEVNQSSLIGDCFIEHFYTVRDDYPITSPNTAMIAVKARAIQIDQISALFTRVANISDGDLNWATRSPTTNPAALFRQVLLEAILNADALPGEIIDEQTMEEWYEHCVTQGYQCNAIIQDLTVDQALQLIAAAGWALPRYHDLYSVVMEKNRSAENPVQLFTPLNSRDLGTGKEFATLPHAIRASYYDEDDDYKLKENVTTYAPGYNVNTAKRIDVVRYDGITDTTLVTDRAQLDIDQVYKRQNRYVREVAQESLVSDRGDLVALNDEVLVYAHKYGRIVRVITSGGNVTGLELENLIDWSEGPTDPFSIVDPFSEADAFSVSDSLGISVRKADGTVDTRAISNASGISRIVTYTTPFADTGVILAGQIVAVGILGLEYKRCIIFNIERGEEETAILTLVDEAPELHS